MTDHPAEVVERVKEAVRLLRRNSITFNDDDITQAALDAMGQGDNGDEWENTLGGLIPEGFGDDMAQATVIEDFIRAAAQAYPWAAPVRTVGSVEALEGLREELHARRHQFDKRCFDFAIGAVDLRLAVLTPATAPTVTVAQRVKLINAFRREYGKPSGLADVKRAMYAALRAAGFEVTP